MKKQILLVLSLSWHLAHAQTALIAHKSHSGNAAHFTASSANFGIPSPRKTKVIKLDDSTVVEVYTRPIGHQMNWNDTIRNHPLYSNPLITEDSLKKLYGSGVTYEGFDNKTSNKTTVPEQKNTAPTSAPVTPPAMKQKQKQRPSKNRSGSLLFILLLSGGGLFITKFSLNQQYH